ncbi:MAG: S1 RNA-binding domain-containing protein [Planctomycetaceae bacterium]|nr:S1 RNA-binding domain-containing protein [Planctomycetaceae bacterium]
MSTEPTAISENHQPPVETQVELTANNGATDATGSSTDSTSEDNSSENKSRLAIGSQRGGVAAEPKAVAQAKANPVSIGEPDEATPEVVAPAVRSSLGLDGQDVDLNLDDAALGNLLDGGQPATPGQVDELVVDQKYQGKVVRLNDENVFFLINGRFDGIVATRTFKKKPAEGDLIEVVVTRHNPEEGLYELRIPGGAIDAAAWDDLAVGALLEVKITGSNTGGLECIVNGIRGFVPGGQIDLARVENFGDYVGKKMELRIIEVDKKKKKLILSRKAILEEAQKETQKEFLKTVEAGAYFDGTVTRVMDFGAFINIGHGVEGMAHVSKLSWDRIKHPKDAVAVGQSVRVKVEKINPENGKISLSVKDTLTNPWYGIAERYPDGTVVKGTVSKLAEFGAFVTLEAGIEGMVHISELAYGRVSTVQSVVKVGDEIEVKVLSIDTKKRRIALSKKATMPAPVDESKAKAKPEVEEKVREMAVKPTKDSLKGGRGKSSGGEQFGLRW